MDRADIRAGLDLRLAQAGPIPLDLALRCEAGQLMVIAGPSGSGKSTILRAIAGLLRPHDGHVHCAGEVWLDTRAAVDLPTRYRRIGFVFQSPALFPHLSALDNVREALIAAPGSAASRPTLVTRAAELLGMVNLAGLEHRLPEQLSGGQQQRVAIARALAREPVVLLLDEPFSALDRVTREKMHRELAGLRRRLSMPIVLVTHDLDEAEMLGDRLALVSKGRLIQQGDPQQVLRRPASVEAARLTGVRNLMRGVITAHDPSQSSTWLDWDGLPVRLPLTEGLTVGASCAWTIPEDGILMRARDRPLREFDTVFEARVSGIIALGAMLQVRLQPFDRAGLPLWMSVPRHLGASHPLREGDRLPLRLRGNLIQLLPDPAR